MELVDGIKTAKNSNLVFRAGLSVKGEEIAEEHGEKVKGFPCSTP